MAIEDIKVIQNFIRMCNDGWLQGWHERNGGNLTYRMTIEEVEACRPYFHDGEMIMMSVSDETLANEYFITTGSGKYMRNVILNPSDNIGIVHINEKGDGYRIVWGLNNAKPTSEFFSHYLNHCVRYKINNENRVIYHAHPANITALTYHLDLTDKAFTKALWTSETECPVVFPQGVGVVEWMVPGGADIAYATSEKMKEYPAVVWAYHGLFVCGKDFDEAFGLMHTIEKAAQIYNLASINGIRHTITDENLRAIAKAFNVELNEKMF